MLDDLIYFEIMKFANMQSLGNLRLTCRHFFQMSLHLKENMIHVLLSFVHHLYSTKKFIRTTRDNEHSLNLGTMICSLIFIRGSDLSILAPFPHLFYDTFHIDFFLEDNFFIDQHFFISNKFCVRIKKYDLYAVNLFQMKEIHITKNNNIECSDSIYHKLILLKPKQDFFAVKNQSIIHQRIDNNFFYFDEYDYFTGERLFSVKQKLKEQHRCIIHADHSTNFSRNKYNFELYNTVRSSIYIINAKQMKDFQSAYTYPGKIIYLDDHLLVFRKQAYNYREWGSEVKQKITYFNRNTQKSTKSYIKHNRIWDYPVTHGFYLSNGQKFEFNEYSHSYIDIYPISIAPSSKQRKIIQKVYNVEFFC